MFAPAFLALPAAFLLLVFALGELSVPHVRKRNVLLAAAYCAFALTLLRAALLLTGWMSYVPHFYEVTLPLNYFLGPIVFAYALEALGRGGPRAIKLQARGLGVRLWPHLLPGLAVFIVLIPNLLQPESIKLERIRAFTANLEAGSSLSDPFALILPLGIAHMFVYLGLILREMLLLLSVKNIRNEGTVRAFLLITGIALCSSASGLFGIAAARPQFIHFAIAMLASIPPLLYVFQRRFPQFFNDLDALMRREREAARYQRSQLEGVDVGEIEDRLEQLMTRDRLYARDDLSLPALADLLGVTAHQLSEYFNHLRNVNFAGYVNGRRIAAAQKLLLSDPSRTVLSVAYEVGFNSKSAFNEAFARHTGASPTQYRKTRVQRC